MDGRLLILAIRDDCTNKCTSRTNVGFEKSGQDARLVIFAIRDDCTGEPMRKYLLLFALVLSGAVAAKPAAEAGDVAVKPTPTQAETAVLAARFLTRFHYKPEPLDAKMSDQISDRYFDAPDNDRLFLLQSDVDRFAPVRDKLGDAIYDEDLTAPFAIFNLYLQRVNERTAYARDVLKHDFDFSKDESYQYQREKTPWAKTSAELDDVWRKRVKNDW